MKTFTLFSALILFARVNSIAQSTLSQITSTANTVNSAAYSAQNVNSAVNNTGSAIKGTASTIKDISSLFKKKKNEEAPKEPVAVVAAGTITITVMGADYSSLKVLEDAIKPIEGVKSTAKKFSSSGSTIEVVYTGKDDQLWDALPETTKEKLTLTDLGNGKIALEQKK